MKQELVRLEVPRPIWGYVDRYLSPQEADQFYLLRVYTQRIRTQRDAQKGFFTLMIAALIFTACIGAILHHNRDAGWWIVVEGWTLLAGSHYLGLARRYTTTHSNAIIGKNPERWTEILAKTDEMDAAFNPDDPVIPREITMPDD